MSTELAMIKGTGKMGSDLQVLQFAGGEIKGSMLQLTQGSGMTIDEPGFIQLTKNDAKALIMQLTRWVKGGR